MERNALRSPACWVLGSLFCKALLKVVFLTCFVIQGCDHFTRCVSCWSPLPYTSRILPQVYSLLCLIVSPLLFLFIAKMRFLSSLVIRTSFPALVPNHFISWHFHNLLLVLNQNVSSLMTYFHNLSFPNLLFGVIFLCQHFLGFSGGEKNVDSKPGMNSLTIYHFPLAINSLRQSRGFCCHP